MATVVAAPGGTDCRFPVPVAHRGDGRRCGRGLQLLRGHHHGDGLAGRVGRRLRVLPPDRRLARQLAHDCAAREPRRAVRIHARGAWGDHGQHSPRRIRVVAIRSHFRHVCGARDEPRPVPVYHPCGRCRGLRARRRFRSRGGTRWGRPAGSAPSSDISGGAGRWSRGMWRASGATCSRTARLSERRRQLEGREQAACSGGRGPEPQPACRNRTRRGSVTPVSQVCRRPAMRWWATGDRPASLASVPPRHGRRLLAASPRRS